MSRVSNFLQESCMNRLTFRSRPVATPTSPCLVAHSSVLSVVGILAPQLQRSQKFHLLKASTVKRQSLVSGYLNQRGKCFLPHSPLCTFSSRTIRNPPHNRKRHSFLHGSAPRYITQTARQGVETFTLHHSFSFHVFARPESLLRCFLFGK